MHRVHVMAGQGRHYLSHPLQHAACVRACFTTNITHGRAGAHRLHNGLRALRYVGFTATLFTTDKDLTRRDHS